MLSSRRNYHTRSVVTFHYLLTSLLCMLSVETSAQIIVDDSPLKDANVIARKPLIGYRKVPDSVFYVLDAKSSGIPEDLFLQSARANLRV